MQRTQAFPLPKVPESILRGDGSPRFGSYRGIPESMSLADLGQPFARDRIRTFLRHKRWMYYFATTDDLIIVGAVVDAGPTGTAFVMITDRATGDVLADTSRPGGVRPFVSVNEFPTDGHRSRYMLPGTRVSIKGDNGELRITGSIHRLPYAPMLSDSWIDFDLRLATQVHPGITVVSELRGHKLASTTAKNACLPISGEVQINDGDSHTTFDLVGGVGGFDYTSGYLPRHTQWRWAYGMTTDSNATSLGLNISSGFTGIGDRSTENMIWLNGVAHRVDPRATIAYKDDDPMASWRVTTKDGTVDLTFEPLALHAESLNLGAVRSKFIQPTGHFTGSVAVEGRRYRVERIPGVVENQDVVW